MFCFFFGGELVLAAGLVDCAWFQSENGESTSMTSMSMVDRGKEGPTGTVPYS